MTNAPRNRLASNPFSIKFCRCKRGAPLVIMGATSEMIRSINQSSDHYFYLALSITVRGEGGSLLWYLSRYSYMGYLVPRALYRCRGRNFSYSEKLTTEVWGPPVFEMLSTSIHANPGPFPPNSLVFGGLGMPTPPKLSMIMRG